MEFNVTWLLMTTTLILGCVSDVVAINCYACSSDKDSNCGEMFIEWEHLSDRFKVSGCAACRKYVVRKSGATTGIQTYTDTDTYVERSCVATKRDSETCTDNGKVCTYFCSSDLCNGQGRISLFTPLILLTALVVLLQRLVGN